MTRFVVFSQRISDRSISTDENILLVSTISRVLLVTVLRSNVSRVQAAKKGQVAPEEEKGGVRVTSTSSGRVLEAMVDRSYNHEVKRDG